MITMQHETDDVDVCPSPLSAIATSTVDMPLCMKAKSELLSLIQTLEPGDSLPPYLELATQMNCSLAPIKQAMKELQYEGRVSLQRGRPAKVLWNNSFSRSAFRAGRKIATRAFEMAYRRIEPVERGIEAELGIEPGRECIICGRVRIVDGRPAALQAAYINPLFFPEPQRFFLEHDVVSGSLSDIYASYGFRFLSVRAVLKVGLADERERQLLSLSDMSPVLRSHQLTIVDRDGCPEVIEVMNATYTQEIEYTVERVPKWSPQEIWNA